MKKEDRVKLGTQLQRLIKSTGQNEATDADGGYLVEHPITLPILAPNFMAGSLYERCRVINVGEMANGVKIPIAAETSRSTAGIRGGVLSYWVGEGVAKTPSTAQFGQLNLGLNKLACVVPVTDELKQDSEALGQYVSAASGDAILFNVDRAILYGNGGQINGVATHPATGFSAKIRRAHV